MFKIATFPLFIDFTSRILINQKSKKGLEMSVSIKSAWTFESASYIVFMPIY
jgi:hypothetical protein